MKDTEIKVNGKCVGEYDMCPDDNRPDWNIHDKNDPRYVKNRPIEWWHPYGAPVGQEVDIFGKNTGYMFNVNNVQRGTIAYIVSNTDPGSTSSYRPRLKQVFYNTELKTEYTAYWELNRLGLSKDYQYLTVEDIGSGTNMFGSNRLCTFIDRRRNNCILFKVWAITDPSKLKPEYVNKFTEWGLYVELVNMPRAVDKYCRISFECPYYRRIDPYYLPINFSDTPYMIPNATSADANKILTIGSDGKPVWKITYEVPAATSADAGKILTVGADGVPVWATPTASASTGETT